MQDSNFGSPIDHQDWAPRLTVSETATAPFAGSSPACLQEPAAIAALDTQVILPKEQPSLADTAYGIGMRAGALTKGRRRDFDNGPLALDSVKIVYWGPGRSGKTTNVKWLHSRLRPELRGQLVDIDSPGERTLYFDCLPLALEPSGTEPTQLRIYTVPGQPRFALTRKLVLDGVDGIVFVWDARARRLSANLASLMELRETLAELGIHWTQIPHVVQYNKCDLPDRIPPEQLDHVLRRMGEDVPRFLSVATRGTGVLDTLGAITSTVLGRRLVETGTMPSAVWG